MSRMLILQLERFGRLSSEEKLALSAVTFRQRHWAGRVDISRDITWAYSVAVLLSGLACRYAVLPGGRRQILAYLLPGDIIDRYTSDTYFPDHCVATLSTATVGSGSLEELRDLGLRFPGIARALALTGVAEQAMLRQWLLNTGRRSALQRTAHLLCELFTRLTWLGLAQDGVCYNLPISQGDLADALALSTVHINRTLMELRRRGLATLGHHQLRIDDLTALRDLAAFEPHYLFAGTSMGQEVRRTQNEARARSGAHWTDDDRPSAPEASRPPG